MKSLDYTISKNFSIIDPSYNIHYPIVEIGLCGGVPISIYYLLNEKYSQLYDLLQ
jgi:hypothetical protein